MNTCDHGIIASAYLRKQLIMSIKEEILAKHKSRIYLSVDGRWATYIPDEKKGRRLIKRKSREDLEDAVVEAYAGKNGRFIDVFHMYRIYHDQMVGENTKSKYDSNEKRYFLLEAFSYIPVENITSDDVEIFIRGKVESQKLCQGATKTLFNYCRATFDFAVRHDLIEKSPMRFLRAKDFYKYTYASERSKKEKLMSDDILIKLSEKYEEDLQRHSDNIPIYAVIFASLTGMRVGEIAALTWDSVHSDYILVDKSQKFNTKTKVYYIDTTKNSKIRKFPLTDDIRELLDRVAKVEKDNGFYCDYIFADEGGGINFRKIASCIKNKCRQLGIETYGIHAYRRTVNSKMAKNGVPVSVRASLLGHSAEVNQRYYTYDASSMDEKIDIISKVNSQMR